MRIILAGFLGAIAMFVWSAIAHMATPLGNAGISKMPHEKVVLDAMKQGIGTSGGLYFYPWVDHDDPKMMEKVTGLMKTEPDGFVIYHPPGSSFTMGPLLVKEFVKQLAQCLIAAFLLSLVVPVGFVSRVGFVFAIGLFAALGQDTSYWIWYDFPLRYTLAQIAIGLGEALAAGLVIAALVKPKPRVLMQMA